MAEIQLFHDLLANKIISSCTAGQIRKIHGVGCGPQAVVCLIYLLLVKL